jgi:hypothetical protein
MKASCPKDSTHKRFITTVIVQESWVLDEEGNQLATLARLEVAPNYSTPWTCAECGQPAILNGLWVPVLPARRPPPITPIS